MDKNDLERRLEENKFKVNYKYIVDENNVLFDTEENAQKCADWLNAHWKEDGNGKTNSKTS